MINVFYYSLDVCFCFMFSQIKYEYDLLPLKQNDSLYFIYPFMLNYYRMFSVLFKCTLYLFYTSRGVFIWRINYCHYHCHDICHLYSCDMWYEMLFATLFL